MNKWETIKRVKHGVLFIGRSEGAEAHQSGNWATTATRQTWCQAWAETAVARWVSLSFNVFFIPNHDDYDLALQTTQSASWNVSNAIFGAQLRCQSEFNAKKPAQSSKSQCNFRLSWAYSNSPRLAGSIATTITEKAWFERACPACLLCFDSAKR